MKFIKIILILFACMPFGLMGACWGIAFHGFGVGKKLMSDFIEEEWHNARKRSIKNRG